MIKTMGWAVRERFRVREWRNARKILIRNPEKNETTSNIETWKN
jgi:hypothetical protein